MISLRGHGRLPTVSTEPNTTLLDRLVQDVKERRKRGEVVKDFGEFEKRLHERVMEVEREVLTEELSRLDVDAAAIQISGVACRRVVRSTGQYQTAAGTVAVERTLYRECSGDLGNRTVSPLDLQLGVVGGRWTPLAAKQACWVVTHMTPGHGEEPFARLGNMAPSKSSLERLPKGISALGRRSTRF